MRGVSVGGGEAEVKPLVGERIFRENFLDLQARSQVRRGVLPRLLARVVDGRPRTRRRS